VFRFETLGVPDVAIALLTPDEKFVVGATIGLFGGPRWFGGRSGSDRGTVGAGATDRLRGPSSAVDSVAESLRRAGTERGRASDAPVDRCERVLDTEPSVGSPVETPPTLRGVHPNTGWARNVRTVTGEVVGSSDGGPTQTFTLATTPAFEPSVWVDELSALPRPEREALESERPDGVERVVGPDGTTRAFWVRWTAVVDRHSSGPDDRHYVVDPTAGRIEFGDGTNGAIPPRGRDNVRADYSTGGGVGGNVPAGSVTDLVSSIAFVDEVRNVDPGDGGADAESRAAALERAPKALRDRDRAVAAADYERLALAASRRLARAKCVPQLNTDRERAPGWVTVVVVPQSGARRPTPSSSLRQTVRERLSAATPASVTAADQSQLVVRGPSYVEVSVAADVVAVEAATSVSAVESAASDAVAAFLHPLTGGSEAGGWAFGELPCLAELYALLESVSGVDHVRSLSVTFRGADDEVTVDEDAAVPRVPADTLVHSGAHEFAVRRVESPAGGVE
jgi:predicted phage baseplate assembly protein